MKKEKEIKIEIVSKDSNGDVIFNSTTPRGGGVGSTRNDIVIWKHKYMNWHQAQKLVQEFYSKNGFIGLRGCNPFLSDRLFAYYETNSYEEIYDYKISDIDTSDKKFKDQVQSYIHKKLDRIKNDRVEILL